MLFCFFVICFSLKVNESEILSEYNLELLSNLTSFFTLTEFQTDYFKWFLYTTEHPHASETPELKEHAKRLSGFLGQLGAQTSFNTTTGNVIAKFSASPNQQSAKTVLLLSHSDMVDTRKTGDQSVMEPINLELNHDKQLRGVDSSIGADGNGGVAAILAYIEHEESYEHGPLEILFSANEETSMSGAWSLTGKEFEANYLLNLEGSPIFGVGWAMPGITNGVFKFPLTYTERNNFTYKVDFTFSGFFGGHSGINALLHGSNAFKILLEFLRKMEAQGYGYDLVSINGGNAANVIPNNISFRIMTNANNTEIDAILDPIFDRVRANANNNDNFTYDKDAEHTFLPARGFGPYKCIENKDDVLKLLDTFNYSVSGFLPPKCFNTTYNIGKVNTDDKEITIYANVRSFIHELLLSFGDICNNQEDFKGLTCDLADPVTEWLSPTTVFAEHILGIINQTVPSSFIEAFPAGAENSVFSIKYPRMPSVLLGIGCYLPHRPDEYLQVNETILFLDYFPKMLEDLITFNYSYNIEESIIPTTETSMGNKNWQISFIAIIVFFVNFFFIFEG